LLKIIFVEISFLAILILQIRVFPRFIREAGTLCRIGSTVKSLGAPKNFTSKE